MLKFWFVGAFALSVIAIGNGTLAAAAVILPPDGATLDRLHTQFRWTPEPTFFGLPAESYQLILVEDNGQPDPFAGQQLVLNLALPADEARTVVTEGLEWGKNYAWRVRGVLYDPLPFGPIYRFSTTPLPPQIPTPTVTMPSGGPTAPGITLINIGGATPENPNGDFIYLFVDQTGKVVHYRIAPRNGHFGHDARLRTDNGRFLLTSSYRALEITLDGGLIWASPEAIELPNGEWINGLHHDVSVLPDGNYMALIYTYGDVDVGGGQIQRWRGDAVVVWDRVTNTELFRWDTHDNLSTLDFDATGISTPIAGTNIYNWTHCNAVTYDEADSSLYLSARHLSRIVKIDYPSGAIQWQMGFDMPSGDATFGDDLFSFEHAPEVQPNGNILLFDNGNRRGHVDRTAADGITKAVEIQLDDLINPTSASIAWEWTVPNYNGFLGDADRLSNGNTLVTSGANSNETAVYEVDPNGNVALRIEVASGLPVNVYRAQRIESLIVDTPGDSDGDWDLDIVDLAQAQACAGDSLEFQGFPCVLSDAVDDDNIDYLDAEQIYATITGPVRF